MHSPARRHKQQEMAKQSALQAKQASAQPSSAQELALLQLAQHKRSLSQIQSSEARLVQKSKLMQEWHSYIDGVLEANSGAIDPIMAQMLPWAFDVGDIPRALDIGAYLLHHDLPAPEHFVRDVASIMAEMAAEAWLNASDQPLIDYIQLQTVHRLTAERDMVDEIRAKLCRALGEAAHQAGDDEMARAYLSRAVKLNPKVGAKPLLKRLTTQT